MRGVRLWWRGEDEPRGDGEVTVKAMEVGVTGDGEGPEKEKQVGAIDGGEVMGKVMGAGELSSRGVRLEGFNSWARCPLSHRELAASEFSRPRVSTSITGRFGVPGPDSH